MFEICKPHVVLFIEGINVPEHIFVRQLLLSTFACGPFCPLGRPAPPAVFMIKLKTLSFCVQNHYAQRKCPPRMKRIVHAFAALCINFSVWSTKSSTSAQITKSFSWPCAVK